MNMIPSLPDVPYWLLFIMMFVGYLVGRDTKADKRTGYKKTIFFESDFRTYLSDLIKLAEKHGFLLTIHVEPLHPPETGKVRMVPQVQEALAVPVNATSEQTKAPTGVQHGRPGIVHT